MANRYWVGGSDTWNATAGTKWALTSGGAGGQAVPTSSDDVFFDANSGAFNVGIVNAVCRNLDLTGFTGNLIRSTNTLTISGNFIASSTSGFSGWNDSTTAMVMNGTGNLNANGNTAMPRMQISSGGTVTLQNNFSSLYIFDVNGATAVLNCNGYTLSCGTLQMSNSGTINASTSTLNVSIYFNAANGTFNCGTSTINIKDTGVGTATFAGGNQTYYKVCFDRGSSGGIIAVSGSNTFTELKDIGTVAHEIRFTTGTTQFFATGASWKISGNSGQLITIRSSTSSGTHSLTVTGSGVVSADYLNIQHSIARPWSGDSGADTWYAGANSTDNQAAATAGSGWIFTAPPASGPANLKSYNTNLKANIKTINTNPLSNIKSLNTNI